MMRRPPRSTLVPDTTLCRSALDGGLIHTLQRAVDTDSYTTFKRYSEAVRRLPPVALRDLLDFRAEGRTPVPIERSEEHTSELQSRQYFVCRLLLVTTITPLR